MLIKKEKVKCVKQKNYIYVRQFKFRVNSDFAEIARFNRFTSVNRAWTPQRVISMICAKLTEQIGNFQVRRFTFEFHTI